MTLGMDSSTLWFKAWLDKHSTVLFHSLLGAMPKAATICLLKDITVYRRKARRQFCLLAQKRLQNTGPESRVSVHCLAKKLKVDNDRLAFTKVWEEKQSPLHKGT